MAVPEVTSFRIVTFERAAGCERPASAHNGKAVVTFQVEDGEVVLGCACRCSFRGSAAKGKQASLFGFGSEALV